MKKHRRGLRLDGLFATLAMCAVAALQLRAYRKNG